MRMGIIGLGDVAKILFAGFLKHGHAVTIGTREAAKLAHGESRIPRQRLAASRRRGLWRGLGPGSQGYGFGRGASDRRFANLAGKRVIDASNPILDAPSTRAGLGRKTAEPLGLLNSLHPKAISVP